MRMLCSAARISLHGSAALAVVIALGLPSLRADRPHNFARWEKAIARFEQQDLKSPPPRNAVLFVGSSSIVFWDLPKYFPGEKAINRGFGGSEIIDSVHFAPRIVLKYQPRLIVFYAGDNDIAAGTTPEQVLADFKTFVTVVHKDLPRTRILYLSIKLSPLRWSLADKMRRANRLIEGYCKQEPLLTYLDVASPLLDDKGKPQRRYFRRDGLHLSAQGYDVWTSLVRPYLKHADKASKQTSQGWSGVRQDNQAA
ncbi:MAG TPA: SGNH/GDSL hydrolase family protein [Gemmataceae bacterium]|nr:SGNH/GDSL hydrolase family protein [Gemmataceae bacterium]